MCSIFHHRHYYTISTKSGVESDNFNINDSELENVETISQPGDIWQLGRHRLLCGDSTNSEDIQNYLKDTVIDLVVTDPPYNVDVQSKLDMLHKYQKGESENIKFTEIKNDNMSDGEFADFLDKAYYAMSLNLKTGGALYIFHSSSEVVNFVHYFKKYFKFSEMLIWVKNNFVLGRADYHYKHEPIIYGWKEGAAHYFVNDRTQTTIIEDFELDSLHKMRKDKLIDYCKELLQLLSNEPTDVIYEDRDNIYNLHPTVKPLKLLAKLIRNSSKDNENVFDPFGGSGSTLIACEQINRTAYLCELELKYSDVIVKRYIAFKGNENDVFLIRNGVKTPYNEVT